MSRLAREEESPGDMALLTELQFQILDAMMDDAEDVEQIYLAANRDCLSKLPTQPKFPLREIIDEICSMREEGYLKAEYTNSQKIAPLDPIDHAMLHHYWFSPTDKAKQAWEQYS